MTKTKKKTRSKNGDGSLYQLSDGRWGASVRFVDENNVKRRKTITNKSKDVAILKMQEWLQEYNSECSQSNSSQELNANSKVPDFVSQYRERSLMPKVKADKIKGRTYLNYRLVLGRFAECFSGVAIGDIGAREMQQFFYYLADKKDGDTGEYCYGQDTIRLTNILLKQMFTWGVQKKYLKENPFDDCDLRCPKANKKTEKVTGLSKEQLKDLLNTMKNSELLYPIIRLMVITGMRTQEVLALTWENINMEKLRVHISGALTKKYEFDVHGEKQGRSETVLSTTKTKKSDRVIYIDEETKQVLEHWRKYAEHNTKTMFGKTDYVFGNTRNAHWTYSGFRNAVNKFLQRSARSDNNLRLHRLRHTVGTILALEGASSIDIMQQLGHSKIETTLRYIDETGEINEKNRDKISHAVSNLGKEKAG